MISEIRPDVEKSYASGWNDGRGGAGGGICGGNAWYCSQWILTEMAGTGGTQTSGWAFGKGEPVLGSGWDPGAGGGGWYGGRSSLKGTGGGGGGSGYLSPELKNGSFGEADRWGSGMGRHHFAVCLYENSGLQYQGGDSHFRNTGLSRAAG